MPEDLSRRDLIKTATVAVAASTAAPALLADDGSPELNIKADTSVPHTAIRVTVNGLEHKLDVEDRWTLAEMLRDALGLTGTKLGCDRGECGACTVIMNGKTVYACSQLAAWSDGAVITTVEGLEHNGKIDPLQQSFMDHDAPQCGFCTSGQLMSARHLLNSNPHPSADEVKAAMTGNICRCSNYHRYVEAVMAVAGGK